MALDIKRMLNHGNWDQDNNIAFSELTKQLRRFVNEALESKHVVRILKSLHFKQIKERHLDIREAHRQTFEWIFNPHSGVSYMPWLRSPDSIYWVTGKAGSGKSTLMKFIQGHSKTQELLRQWAQNQGLIIATHYFWSAGTSLQKSQVGLFRTLLFQILAQCPEIIPQVLPNRWRSGSIGALESWTRAELLAAFKRLASLPRLRDKICLFVDGLDEYNGDHPELINLFRLLAQSPSLKICLSSRPWQDFIDAFGVSEWKLYVQELTKNDIRLYVKDNLEQDTRFQTIRMEDQEGADALAQQIQMKAHGVFLWVYLVVRSLLRGLANSDEMVDLHRRLNELPNELEKYFELMLDTIEPIYQRQTAKVFRLMLTSFHTLPVIAFYFVGKEQLDPNYILHERIEPLSSQKVATTVDQQKRQLNASCRDLLFVTTDLEASSFSGVKVGFLHRTVMDFLRTGQMDNLLSVRSGANFNPNSSLCKAYWAMYKAFPSDTAISVGSMRETMIAGMMYYAREVERQSEYSEISILDDLARTVPLRMAWSDLVGDRDCTDFLDVAVRFDLKLYVTEKTKKLGKQSRGGTSRGGQIATLLRQALRGGFCVDSDDCFQFSATDQIGLSMLQRLLEDGAGPNAKLDRVSVLSSQEISQGQAEQELIEKLCNENPEHSRSVWGDFLMQLRIDCPIDRTRQEAWDMNRFLDPSMQKPSMQKERKLLDNAYEACEFMISYGANRHYQKIEGMESNPRQEYLTADGVFLDVFPGDARKLIHLLERKEKSKEKRQWCITM